LDPEPPKQLRRTLDAIRYLESKTTGAFEGEGLVLRYGAFYGPGTGMLERSMIDHGACRDRRGERMVVVPAHRRRGGRHRNRHRAWRSRNTEAAFRDGWFRTGDPEILHLAFFIHSPR
jgi:hypothetical protein